MVHNRSGLRIRLARHGIRNQPLYHVVVIDKTKARQALPLEKLGEWDPIPQVSSIQDLHSSSLVFGRQVAKAPHERRLLWNAERIRYWLDQGAEPSDTVINLLEKGGLIGPGHKFRNPGTWQNHRLSRRLVNTTSDIPLSELGKQAVWSQKPDKPSTARAKPSSATS